MASSRYGGLRPAEDRTASAGRVAGESCDSRDKLKAFVFARTPGDITLPAPARFGPLNRTASCPISVCTYAGVRVVMRRCFAYPRVFIVGAIYMIAEKAADVILAANKGAAKG